MNKTDRLLAIVLEHQDGLDVFLRVVSRMNCCNGCWVGERA